MDGGQPITLRRECEAVLIPSGEKLKLQAGSRVRVTHSLGGSFTVMTDRGHMARIAGKDADALGIEAGPVAPPAAGGAERSGDVERLVWDRLKTCFDPEIPVNIVDLGLVYHCRVEPRSGGGSRVEIRFTLTAPGCGMGEVLKADIKREILSVPGVQEVDVQLVWDPPWNQSMISPEARRELGMV
jgi:probable FeS assembly SUF system protein SufT